MEIKDYTTAQLVDELKTRIAVQHLFTEPYEDIEIFVGHKKQDLQIDKGPVNILIVWD